MKENYFILNKKIEDIIFKTLDQAGYITTSNDKIVKNGIKRVIHLLEDFSFVIVISVVFGKLEAGILMEFLFFLLRIYAGGYHAKDEMNCKILTYGSIVGGIFFVSFLHVPLIWLNVLTGLGCLVIYIFAPVENNKRILGKKEKREFQKKIRIIVIGVVIVAVIVNLMHNEEFLKAITYDVIIISIGLAVQKRLETE